MLRGEIAHMQGFTCHAVLKMQERMAESIEGVKKILEDMRKKLQLVARLEEQRLMRLKLEDSPTAEDGSNQEQGVIYPWEWNYYDQKFMERNYSAKTLEIAEHFEVQHTLEGLFSILSNLFGLQFDCLESASEVETWHPEVTIYAVWYTDNGGGDSGNGFGFLGYLYLDLFGRPGKYEGAYQSMVALGFVSACGIRHYPSSALICSFSRGTDDWNDMLGPTLLLHSEMRTVFHELGHAIHYLVSRIKYALPFSKDFVEIPSLLLEHWVWVPQVLKRLGRHYQTGMELPEALIRDLVRTKTVNQAHTMLGEVHLALFDLAIHSPRGHHPDHELDLTRLWNESKTDVVGLPLGESEDEGFGQAGFPHILRKYDAGYFAYPLYVFRTSQLHLVRRANTGGSRSKVYASDIYSAVFATDPMRPEAGRRYRSMMLEPGASKPEADILKDYMGRDCHGDAYYAEL